MKVLSTCVMLAVMVAGCQPDGRSPGLWLSGEEQPFADDWRFTDGHREIAIEVATPYLLPHSVTIWCAQLEGDLYLAAGQADTKNWPGWVDDDPDVVLKIGDDVYTARLSAIDDAELISRLQTAYASKYNLEGRSPIGASTTRYWSVAAR